MMIRHKTTILRFTARFKNNPPALPFDVGAKKLIIRTVFKEENMELILTVIGFLIFLVIWSVS